MLSPAGAILVGEVRHVRVQPVDDLVEALGLPVAEILRIVRAAAGPVVPGLQDIPVRAVGSVEIDLEFVEEILGVILPVLHSLRRRHGGIAVPVQPETHPVPVRIFAGREHALGPQRGVPDRRMRFMRGVAVPPVDIDDHVLEAQRGNVVDQRIILGFRGTPASLPLARRGKGVPFHFRIAGVLVSGARASSD